MTNEVASKYRRMKADFNVESAKIAFIAAIGAFTYGYDRKLFIRNVQLTSQSTGGVLHLPNRISTRCLEISLFLKPTGPPR